jgi:4'-phosphopantetheinyl transferase
MFLFPGDVHLWCGRTDLAVSSNVLSDDERKRASRYQFARDKERFTAARGMLRRILAACLDVPPDQVSFTYSPNGKPTIANSQALQFNLSHSGDFAVCAVSVSRRIGVDIEQIRPLEDMESVFRIISSGAEQAEFDALPERQRVDAFYRCWTMKEACVKAHGTGLSTAVDSIEVLTPHETPHFIDCNGLRCRVVPFVPLEGYAGALAFDQEPDCGTPARVILHSEMVCSSEISDAHSFSPVVGRNWEESRVRGGGVWI